MSLLAATLLLLVSTSCSVENPVGPEIDPLVGQWTGTFVSPLDGRSSPNSLTLTVQTGGRATGTGSMWITINEVPISESIFLRAEVAPDGSVDGYGGWLAQIFAAGAPAPLYAEGRVTGTLDAANGTGSGELRAEFTDGISVISWEVTLEGR